MMRNWHTMAIVVVFALSYLYFTARKTARLQIDIYDLVMLSAVAIIPSIFVLLPDLGEYLSRLSGVAFPFVIMFGALFAILFIFVHRLTAKVHRLENDNRALIQELSLLKAARSVGHAKSSGSLGPNH
jgi:Uncharacterized conserved protein (DUF2304).